MNWIDVENNLPDLEHKTICSQSEDVLVLDYDGTMYVAYLTFYPCVGYSKIECLSWSNRSTGCGCCERDLNPTHWMSLPKSPKDIQ
jgi:hypothetical protein